VTVPVVLPGLWESHGHFFGVRAGAALRVGVRTIEHGSYLDEDAARAMKLVDAILVSTRLVVERLLGMKDELLKGS